jgi:hypothetical protein
MPRYARHDRMKGQDRVWGFLASLETTEKGCHPEPFLSPRAKRGVSRWDVVPNEEGVPRRFRASGRQKGECASG